MRFAQYGIGISVTRESSLAQEKTVMCTFVNTTTRVTLLLALLLSFISCGHGDGSLGGGASSVSVTISSPPANSTSTTRLVDLIGKVTAPGSVSISTLHVDCGGLVTTVDASGHFVVPSYPLTDGENDLAVTVIDDSGQTIGSTTHVVFWDSPSEGFGQIDPAVGGTVSVTSPSSPIVGASLHVPAGAAVHPLIVKFEYDPEHTPNPPFGYVTVGEPVTAQPLGEAFLSSATLGVPIDRNRFPAGTDEHDVVLFGMGNADWTPIDVVSAEPTIVSGALNALYEAPYVAMIRVPLVPGELRVISTPANATLYVDGFNTHERTPVRLTNVQSGHHDLKLYLGHFNEIYGSVDVAPTGTEASFTLGVPAAPIPTVAFDPSIYDGMIVASNLLNVFGTVQLDGAPFAAGTVVISLNGEDGLTNVSPNGNFNDFVSLLPGDNTIEVRGNSPSGSTGASPLIHVYNSSAGFTSEEASASLSAALTWDSDFADVDMHVFDPDGNHAYYGALGGIPGAQIDHDDVDGYGPEIFSFPLPTAGVYHFRVDYYAMHAASATTATLKVYVGTTLKFLGHYALTEDDFNATNGNPIGANPSAFWDACVITIDDIQIISVTAGTACDTVIPPNSLTVTTAPSENHLNVTTVAPVTILDNQISYQVTETVEGHVVDTTGVYGRMAQIDITHDPLVDYTNPRFSHALEFQIIAIAKDSSGSVIATSQPYTLIQDVRAQIRQEYIDKDAFGGVHYVPIPACSDIIDASGFPQRQFFTFAEFSRNSDFGPNLSVVRESHNIATIVRQAWGKPLVVNSGWRNPRRNDSLDGSVLNSHHQTGDALDMDPSSNPTEWPAGISNYSAAQSALLIAARNALPVASYDCLFHQGHVHVELH